MDKVVDIEDKNARMLITKLLSYDELNREGLDLFQNSKFLSLEGHSLGQDVHFDKYTLKDSVSQNDLNNEQNNADLKSDAE